MSIVCVEGCDGSGKTTLIEKARGSQKDRYFLTVRASRYPPDVSTAVRYLNFVTRTHSRLDVVLDRIHFISDRIYGPVLRNADIFKDFSIVYGLSEVDIVVYARPPREVILENVRKGMQLGGVIENAEAIIDRYDEHMAKLRNEGVTVMVYDYTSDDPVVFWNHVWQKAQGE